MLKIENLTAGYEDGDAVHSVSFTAPREKLTVILGPNGCGKSTLLKCLCGIHAPKSGSVTMDEQNLLALPRKDLARRVAYLSQSRTVPDITVERMVLHGRFPYLSYPRRYRKEDMAAAASAIEQMGLSHLAHTPLANLSGGQRQKVYIAMALAQDTPLILMDEPTTYLDIRHQLHLMQEVEALKAKGKTAIMILHDLPHAFAAADKIVVMDKGCLVFEGSPTEALASGCIEKVFGVSLVAVDTPRGKRYYLEGETQ
ncbi:MAG: ABC transporter ATP-binding protein [Oscillospiraceae bacterium]|nr:ABC transporter ATP-binding protein [Oscillospiraceae bacterium]